MSDEAAYDGIIHAIDRDYTIPRIEAMLDAKEKAMTPRSVEPALTDTQRLDFVLSSNAGVWSRRDIDTDRVMTRMSYTLDGVQWSVQTAGSPRDAIDMAMGKRDV